MENSTDTPGSSLPQMLRIPYAHLPHGLVTFPRRILPWIEPWFLAYACLGVVQGGMLPLLLPLSAGGSTHAGTIVGVMNLAGLTAPFWGHLADRRRLHRQVLLAGMLLVLAPLLLMPAVLGLPLKAALAGVLGIGFAAANTVSNMFIVEVRPKEEWDARIAPGSVRCKRWADWARFPGCYSPDLSAAGTRWRSGWRRASSLLRCRSPG
jgi:hypothetical protein